jgi:poly-gamma-glutamate synthesis protein (capsule biosynthesis protein)
VGPFAPVFRQADLAMLNLETAITSATTAEAKTYTFKTNPQVLDAFDAAGIDAVSLANNHGMDYGWAGFRDTLRAKQDSDSPVVLGIGEDEESAYAPWIAEVKGQRIAFFTATQVLDGHLTEKWTAGPDKGGLASAKRQDYLTDTVAAVRPDVDTVVVFLHWGVEKMNCPTQDQVDLAKALRSAGADIIVGGHQHRLSGGGMMGDTYVHYGLGNFLFHAGSSGAEKTGVLTVDVQGREIVDAQWHPGRVSDGVPQRLTGADKERELAYWNSLRGCANLDPVR